MSSSGGISKPLRPPPPKRGATVAKSISVTDTSSSSRPVPSRPVPPVAKDDSVDSSSSKRPPKPPRTYKSKDGLRHRSATLPSGARLGSEVHKRPRDMTEVQQAITVDLSTRADPKDFHLRQTSLQDGMTDDLTALKRKTVSLSRVKTPPTGSEDLKKYRTTSVDSAISCGGSDESKGQEDDSIEDLQATKMQEIRLESPPTLQDTPTKQEDTPTKQEDTPTTQEDTPTTQKSQEDTPSQSKPEEDTPKNPTPPKRPVRPPPSVYQKYMNTSPVVESRPLPTKERKTVHFGVSSKPERDHPSNKTMKDRGFTRSPLHGNDTDDITVAENPLDLDVEDCVGLDVMVKLQAPLAGEIMEEMEDFEYPEWARKRTGKNQRKTKTVKTERELRPSSSGGGLRRTILRLCFKGQGEEEKPESPCSGLDAIDLSSFPIDPLVLMCVSYLNTEKCLKEEGLFRIPGNMTDIQRLYGKFNGGHPIDLCSINDPACVAGLLKMYFRNRQSPLIPRGPLTVKITTAAANKNYAGVKDSLEQLPEENLITLQMMIELLHQVSLFSETNHMTSGNLATSCGLSVFPTMQAFTSGLLLKYLIDNCHRLFVQSQDGN